MKLLCFDYFYIISLIRPRILHKIASKEIQMSSVIPESGTVATKVSYFTKENKRVKNTQKLQCDSENTFNIVFRPMKCRQSLLLALN